MSSISYQRTLPSLRTGTITTILLGLILLFNACSGTPSTPPDETVASPAEPARSVLYYFHRTIRCTECLSMELFTGMLVKAEFADALAMDTLVYATVNLDDPGNEGYAEDFNLTYSTLVLVDEDETGTILRWKDLEDAWLKSADQAAFKEYVAGEIRTWLKR